MVHKSVVPLRPILDMSGSPLHTTAKWLSGILKPLQNSVAKYNLRDSYELVEQIKRCTTNDKRIVSLDASSLRESLNYKR